MVFYVWKKTCFADINYLITFSFKTFKLRRLHWVTIAHISFSVEDFSIKGYSFEEDRRS